MSKADMQRENAANNKNIAVKCLSDVIKKKWKLWKFHRAAIAQNREPRSHVNRKFLNEKPFHVQFSLEWRKNVEKINITLGAGCVGAGKLSSVVVQRDGKHVGLRKQTAVRMNHRFNPLSDAFNSQNMNNFIYFIRFRRVYCVASRSRSSNWRKFTGGNFRITLHGLWFIIAVGVFGCRQTRAYKNIERRVAKASHLRCCQISHAVLLKNHFSSLNGLITDEIRRSSEFLSSSSDFGKASPTILRSKN